MRFNCALENVPRVLNVYIGFRENCQSFISVTIYDWALIRFQTIPPIIARSMDSTELILFAYICELKYVVKAREASPC